MPQYDCMIGVSTEQNTTNLIPAVRCGIQKFWLVETSGAFRNQWGKGLASVLKSRNISPHSLVLKEGEDTRIDLISQKLEETLGSDPVIWNLGGGQKAQQLALWQTFLKRSSQGISDRACYTNPEKHHLEWWDCQDGALRYTEEKTHSDLRLDELLTLFGFERNGGTLLYKKERSVDWEKILDLFSFHEFRDYLIRLPQAHPAAMDEVTSYTVKEIERHADDVQKKISDSVYDCLLLSLKNGGEGYLKSEENRKNFSNGVAKRARKELILELRGQKEPDFMDLKDRSLLEILSSNFPDVPTRFPIDQEMLKKISGCWKAADYFEKIVIQRMKDILETHNHYIEEAYYNLEVKKSEGATPVAEYDVLLVTQWGTLIAIDAKTFDLERKDHDARLYNLQQVGGRYVDFVPVFPYHPQDITKTNMPEELLQLPLTLSQRKTKFFVIADGVEKSFTVARVDGKVKLMNSTLPGQPCARCIPLDQFLKEMKLQ